MKSYFDFSLRGGDWWGAFVVFWVLYWIFYAPELLMQRNGQFTKAHPGLYLIVVAILTLAICVLVAVFAIVFARIILPKLSIGGGSFTFRGSIGRYVGIVLGGTLLSIVTLSVYLPWFMRRVTSYLLSQMSYRDVSPEFLGRAGKLFKYLVLALWVPIIVLVAVIVLIAVLGAMNASSAAEMSGPARTITWLVTIFTVIVLIPFFYLTYKWQVNIRWNRLTIQWRTRFWPSCGMIFGQLLLAIVTLSVYWPVAFLRLYRYFVGRTVLTAQSAAATVGSEGSEIGRLGFDGQLGYGFGLLWGQALLSIITLGIYLPWAYARIGRWLLGASYVERAAAETAE